MVLWPPRWGGAVAPPWPGLAWRRRALACAAVAAMVVGLLDPDHALALLQLKHWFTSIDESVTAFQSWKSGKDCYEWDGIHSGAHTGHVISLDLGDRGLETDHLDHVLFELTSLRHLHLGGNNFNLSEIPSTGFERLTSLTHLNLSNCNFAGQVPAYSIGQLTKLVSLNISFTPELTELFNDGYRFSGDITYLGQLMLPNLTALVANLTRLRELHLGWVYMLGQGEEWCNGLAKHTLDLRVLSLPFCFLSSPICGPLDRLHSLSTI
ncbi:hypothetical protein QYE76_000159 [Lolium multiflorum]|uniref:Leucine-rich repeat-containing N-terminal plant-type domain-containing protein n=1 Tax=Lolium multiflorum TaxID=4521 RepID=A0AAD8RIQ9_LOLMU|nr:hypothetical protein QYE76_000159 [Lolium multiflorum]